MHIPARVFHGYRNQGTEPGRILFIIAPAGMTEQFFEEIGVPVTGDRAGTTPPPDPKRLGEIMRRYGVTVQLPTRVDP